MAKRKTDEHLSRRERQIMDILYERGRATASDVLERLPDPPSYSAVRAMLRLLEEKGVVLHDQEGPRYVYRPAVSRAKARQSAIKRLVRTFFGGSTEQAVAALLEDPASRLDDEQLDRLARLIDQARKEGR
jgi:BlaI family penicillinase repressor